MQNKVKEFNLNKGCHTKEIPVYARMLDIISEMGEFSKEYLKPTKYGTNDFVVTEDFKMEFGDVLYSLLSLANETKIDAEECLNMAIEKYTKRIENKKNIGSGR